MNTQARGVVTGKCIFISFVLCAGVAMTHAVIPDPGGGAPPPAWLDYWSFNNTNTWASDRGYAPAAFTNLDASLLGNWTAVLLDRTNAAWLRYKVIEDDGTNHLTLERGSVMFWFAPTWSGTNAGGNGPGQYGRLLEAGAYTTNASYGWWGLYTDPEGVNLYFSAQTNGADTTFLSAPISWATNRWHLIALTYSATNTALYVDGALATNGPGVTLWPGPEALTNGFSLGSDSTGLAQARGMFDELSTYAFPLDADTIATTFWFSSIFYYMNPANPANFWLSSAPPSPPVYGPSFVAITGTGYLGLVSSNASGCVVSNKVWLTNVVASFTNNGTMNATFTILGGSNGVPYDVFANSFLTPTSDASHPWSWVGQGYHCSTYTLTNLPNTTAFLILGQPTDSDLDGLTDAYELLVSKTDPTVADTDGDGLIDGWEIINGLSARADDAANSQLRANYTYDPGGWLTNLFGIESKSFALDAEGNVGGVSP